MKLRIVLGIFMIGMLWPSARIMAQDAEKQKLIEIEKALAANPTPDAHGAAVAKQYFYNGDVSQMSSMGRIGTLPKAKVIDLFSNADPADPEIKTTQVIRDIRVQLYGDTAMVWYRISNTDTGHKKASLNKTSHFGCLDTFVKRDSQWYLIGGACADYAPIPLSPLPGAVFAVKRRRIH